MRNRPPKGTIYVLPLRRWGVYVSGLPCDHVYGRWGVLGLDGVFYAFGVATALQRDLWIRAGRDEEERKARCRSVRWFCRYCNTVQPVADRYSAPDCADLILLSPNASNVIDKSKGVRP